MSHDVFISFSSRDIDLVRRLVSDIEASGLSCWFSARDVGPGRNYQEAIVEALGAAPVFVLVFSEHSNESPEVHKELSLASAFRKLVIPVRTSNIMPKGAFAYELATRQWVDTHLDWSAALARLVAAAGTVTGARAAGAQGSTAPVEAAISASAPVAQTFTASEIERARAALVPFLGKDSAGLVDAACRTARSVQALHAELAQQLPSDDARAQFLAAARRPYS